jgi:hypothetical protein
MQDAEWVDENQNEDEAYSKPRSQPRQNKERRVEQMGNKKFNREIYKVGKDRERQRQKAKVNGDRRQWSR